MALNSTSSALVSFALSLMLYASMQYFKVQLGTSELMTILGGFMGSVLFVLLLTGLNNLENTLLDDYFQAKIFPEVFISLIMSLFSCAMVHRVSVTTCCIFSLIHLYYINNISHGLYQSPAEVTVVKSKGKKKRN